MSARASTPSASPRPAAPAGCWRNGWRRGEAPMDLWVVDIRRFSDLHKDRDWVSRPHARSLRQALHRSAFRMRNMRAAGRASSRRSMSGSKALNAVLRLEARLGAAELVRAGRRGAARHLFHGPAELVRAGRARSTGRCASAVGLFDQSSFAKYELTGRDAAAALSWICANDVAKPPGRLTYTQMLNIARRHRMRPDRRAARRGPFLHRHRHRLPHP